MSNIRPEEKDFIITQDGNTITCRDLLRKRIIKYNVKDEKFIVMNDMNRKVWMSFRDFQVVAGIAESVRSQSEAKETIKEE